MILGGEEGYAKLNMKEAFLINLLKIQQYLLIKIQITLLLCFSNRKSQKNLIATSLKTFEEAMFLKVK